MRSCLPDAFLEAQDAVAAVRYVPEADVQAA